MVGATNENRVNSPEVENYRYGPVSCLGHDLLPQSFVLIEVDLRVGKSVCIEGPLGTPTVGADGLTEEQEVRLCGL